MIDKYRSQIQSLADRLKCKLEVDPKFRTSAMMFVEFSFVQVPPIDNQIDYLINLHELGHVAYGHTQGRPPHEDKKFYFENGVLKSEAQAWQFALDNFIGEPDDQSRLFCWDICLGTYYQEYLNKAGEMTQLWNGNRHHVKFIYDKPDEYFDSIVKRIQGKAKGFKIEYNGLDRSNDN